MELLIDETGAEVTRVSLVGQLDSVGVDEVEAQFEAAIVAAGKNAIVDISRVDFMASLGIRMLVTCAKALHRQDATMVLLSPQGFVAGVIQDVALEQLIPVVPTEAQALAILAE